MLPGTVTSDSDLVAELLDRAHPRTERNDGRDLQTALETVLPS